MPGRSNFRKMYLYLIHISRGHKYIIRKARDRTEVAAHIVPTMKRQNPAVDSHRAGTVAEQRA